mmetsp:Transcript_35344/g.55163  ORF Transcript_35344/g.55163 Transcript_35344/m.55163 type:complete len:92 (+) Transcript_35344:178-453(+)
MRLCIGGVGGVGGVGVDSAEGGGVVAIHTRRSGGWGVARGGVDDDAVDMGGVGVHVVVRGVIEVVEGEHDVSRGPVGPGDVVLIFVGCVVS